MPMFGVLQSVTVVILLSRDLMIDPFDAGTVLKSHFSSRYFLFISIGAMKNQLSSRYIQ